MRIFLQQHTASRQHKSSVLCLVFSFTIFFFVLFLFSINAVIFILLSCMFRIFIVLAQYTQTVHGFILNHIYQWERSTTLNTHTESESEFYFYSRNFRTDEKNKHQMQLGSVIRCEWAETITQLVVIYVQCLWWQALQMPVETSHWCMYGMCIADGQRMDAGSVFSFDSIISAWDNTLNSHDMFENEIQLSDWLSVSWSLNTFPLDDRRRQLLNRNYSLPHERFSGHVEFPTSKRWYWHKRVRRVHAMFIASLVHHNGYDTMCNVHMCILCVQRKVTRPKAECVAAQCAMEVARCKTGTKHQSQSLNWNLKVLRWQYLLVLYALVFTLLSA